MKKHKRQNKNDLLWKNTNNKNSKYKNTGIPKITGLRWAKIKIAPFLRYVFLFSHQLISPLKDKLMSEAKGNWKNNKDKRRISKKKVK